MYSVSTEYKKAIRQRVVNDRIAGSITLSDGARLPISDQSLVRNSLKISHELCGDYRIGTFHIGCLQIAVFDDNALLRDFSGARIEPIYQIETENGWESVPMGIYYTDGNSVRRKRNTVSLTAYDSGCFFDRTIPEGRRTPVGNAQILVKAACEDCGVAFGGIPTTLPNYGVTVSAADPQIQTYRDMIAWCAELLCAYAVIDREGKLRFRSAKYGVSPSDNTDILIDKYLTEAERNSITVTDTRAYIRSICAYSGGALKTYVSDVVQTDTQAAPAGYTFAENPLLPKTLTEEQQDAVNTARLAFIDGFKQRGINAEIYGDPALDAGDVLRCSGGDIDQRRSIVGLVTKQEWRYRNFHTVVCAAPPLLGRDAASAAVVASQTDKKLDAMKRKCEYIAGTGIKVVGNTIHLKPAKSGWYGEKEKILGGVWSDDYGVKIEEDGRIHLTSPMQGALGGIFPPSYGLYTLGGELRADLGKGMMFYTPDCASSASHHLVISPRLGDGLRMEPEEEDGSDESAEPSDREKSEAAIQINAGEGLEFGERESFPYRYGVIEKTGFTSKLRVKLGKGLSFGEDGEINAEGDGAELTAGGGITIETDGETGTRTIAAAVGEGAEIRGGKICTVPNVQNAVFLSEKDAKYLLHNFSQVEYIAGNKIGYAGPGNQIVLQGTICYQYKGTAPNGKIVDNASSKDPSELPDIPLYTSLGFSPAIEYLDKFFVGVKVNFVSANNSYNRFQIVGTDEDQKETALVSINVYDKNGVEFALIWSEINAPSDPYPCGFAKVRIGYRCMGASNTHQMGMVNGMLLTVPFASPAEYQAAVGLTYEPLTLTRVEDEPTVVSGKGSEGE